MQQQVDLTLMEFVEQQILPRYAAFGKSHGMFHVTRVINNIIGLARQVGADINMAYTIAAYHDLGMEGPRAIHHLTSGKILAADARLRKWFSPEQLKIMREAVEDHRASASHAPRSIYGKLVAEADRDIEPEIVFTRCIEFGLEREPGKGKEWHWERFASHMENKYSINGYIKLWIPNSPNEQRLKKLRTIIADKDKLRRQFEIYYNKMKGEKNE